MEDDGEVAALPGDLFRRESSRLVAALARWLGPRHVALVEDVVQETLISAFQAWQLGLPDEPRAWLIATAKNKAIDALRRERRAGTSTVELDSEEELVAGVHAALAPARAEANELGMMLSCCHDELSEETQVTLILRFLCGFGPREIASAFLVDVQTIDRRLHRGRARLAMLGKLHEVEDEGEVRARLPSVIRALYLVFNEGYHGSDAEHPVRAALCAEAIRLVELLLGAQASARPEVHALQALFCFHAARLGTRLDPDRVFVALADQDRSRWDRGLVDRGVRHLAASASGERVTRWHVEAGIAYEHAAAPSMETTNWTRIVELYDLLVELAPGPVVAFNRALAVTELRGAEAGLAAIAAIANDTRLRAYSFYWAGRGELAGRTGDADAARGHYTQAMVLARSRSERVAYERKLRRLDA